MDNLDLLLIDGQIATFVAIVLFLLLFIFTGVKRVDEGRAKIIERLGRRHKVIRPGLNVIVPILDKVKTNDFVLETILDGTRMPLVSKAGISIAEHRMDPPVQKLMARDNSEINIDSVVYFRITDPIKIVYDVNDFAGSFESLIQTTLRQEVGKYDGDTIITARETLSDALKTTLLDASNSWGITVLRVEIEHIGFEEKVNKALSEAREEELLRRADLVAKKAEAEQQLLLAEAKRKADILEAEGEKQAIVLRAEGDFQAKKLEAEGAFLIQSREQEGKAKGYAAIATALKENPEAIVALEALKAQALVAESLGNSSNSMIIPAETAGLFGAMGSIMKAYETTKSQNPQLNSRTPETSKPASKKKVADE
jgi:regulator of protease activity HflC (stomatin/prohibitin superfamily)